MAKTTAMQSRRNTKIGYVVSTKMAKAALAAAGLTHS